MKIEVQIEPGCREPRVVIHTDRMTDEVSALPARLETGQDKPLVGFSEGTATVLAPETLLRVYQEVWNAAVALKEGEVSELLQVGDTFYLIKRLSDLPAGTASFEDDAEAYTAAALAEQQQKEWDAVQEDWLSEARNAAVFYEENYAGVGVQ